MIFIFIFLLSLYGVYVYTRVGLCDPMGWGPRVPPVHRIFQARILEWVPFPSPGDLPNLGVEPASLALAVSFVGRQVLY